MSMKQNRVLIVKIYKQINTYSWELSTSLWTRFPYVNVMTMEVAFNHQLLNSTTKDVAPDLQTCWWSRTNDPREWNGHLTRKWQYHASAFCGSHIPRGQIEERGTPTPALDELSSTMSAQDGTWVISWWPVGQATDLSLRLKESTTVLWALGCRAEKPFLIHRSPSPVRHVVESARSSIDYDSQAIRWQLRQYLKRWQLGIQDATDRWDHIPEPILSTVSRDKWHINDL